MTSPEPRPCATCASNCQVFSGMAFNRSEKPGFRTRFCFQIKAAQKTGLLARTRKAQVPFPSLPVKFHGGGCSVRLLRLRMWSMEPLARLPQCQTCTESANPFEELVPRVETLWGKGLGCSPTGPKHVGRPSRPMYETYPGATSTNSLDAYALHSNPGRALAAPPSNRHFGVWQKEHFVALPWTGRCGCSSHVPSNSAMAQTGTWPKHEEWGWQVWEDLA